MLGSISDTTGGGWKVLVVDDTTTKVLSSALKMSDILDAQVSVVEDLHKAREPLPMAGVYFVTPTPDSVEQILDDFSGSSPLYPSVHIFFSSRVSSEAVARIKSCAPLMRVLRTLKEGNLEFLTVDSRTTVTGHPLAAVKLMGDAAEVAAREADAELSSIATRLATLCATLNEMPAIRYKVGRVPDAADPPGAAARQTLTARLAKKLSDRVDAMSASGNLPTRDTCDLIILDRSYDPLAPVIHEWTYEALVYDLLDMEGHMFKYSVEATNGKAEKREVALDELDALWCELRHMFIADVYTTLAQRFKEFQAKNKAAKLGGGGLKEKGELSTGNIRALITALPQFREVLTRMSTHIQISSDLKAVTNERLLTDVGELEQDVVLGEKSSKDMIAFLSDHSADLDTTDKMRLLMCYCLTHPGKLDATRRVQWQKLARLSGGDMAAIANLAFLGVNVEQKAEKETKGSFFGKAKDKDKGAALRRKKAGADDEYALFRFEPLLRDILVDAVNSRLTQDEFPYVRPPVGEADLSSGTSATSARTTTARTGLNWAKRNAGDGAAGGGRRLIVFIIGGAVRSEMRIVHDASRALGRDIILGTTSVETPHTFVDTLYRLSSQG